MREIKYRAWGKHNHRWLGLFQLAFAKDGSVMAVNTLDGETYGLHQVDIIQYTGLKDKNGKEIYEGDIVYYKGEDVHGKIYEPRYEVKFGIYDNGEEYDSNTSGCGWYLLERVMFRDGKFESYENDVYDYRGLYGLGDMEVIGNIYENKDLLNG